MRARTRVTAWAIIVLGTLVEIYLLSTPEVSRPDRTIAMVSGAVSIVLWAAVLLKQQWARRLLLILLMLDFAGAMYSAAGTPAARQNGAAIFWALYLPISIAIFGWQALVLLKEDPGSW